METQNNSVQPTEQSQPTQAELYEAYCHELANKTDIEEVNLPVIKRLLEQGLDINSSDNHNGNTPLHLGVFAGDIEFVNLLLKNEGLNINCQDNNGSTPLHMAVNFAHFELAEFLIEHGADLSLQDNEGNTIGHYLVSGLIDFLQEDIKDLNEICKNNGSGSKIFKEHIEDKKLKYNITVTHHCSAREQLEFFEEQGLVLSKNNDGKTANDLLEEWYKKNPSFEHLIAYYNQLADQIELAQENDIEPVIDDSNDEDNNSSILSGAQLPEGTPELVA